MPRTSTRGGPQTRARIAQIADKLFYEHGFENVTVAQVAKEAGVSSVTVFKHFPRKEDLFLDRSEDAVELLRSAVRDRATGTDVLESLRVMALGLTATSHPLSGLDPASDPFFATLAASPALIARARDIASDLQQTLTAELEQDGTFDGDAPLLAAFFIAGYSSVLVETARRRIAGASPERATDDHRTRLEGMFAALRNGVLTRR
ncbi:TetR/AcrR family transcriptional regulator [Kineosporia mesophila]|uniref:TetR/AcrR family transcriptional regulator n=1 Tax=Kineosporia mesophila TaxID=566012 RepID=A0ABP6Z5S5_9ACTN|nr:TetR/AcrR family transcriptional regulator [Kineosporia mesophila]MCD5352681.1 TetR/AcrR family transcriptional regulator [Kineosporia mesophila]